MSLLGAKLFLQKAWVWCRHNWKISALVVYTIVLYLLFSKNTRNAKKILEDARTAHKAEVDALNKSHTENLKKRDENLKKYNEALKVIEEKLATENKKIDSNKKKRVKEIVNEHGDDPQKLAELLKETFGFDIVTNDD